jgi:hypothetical protein
MGLSGGGPRDWSSSGYWAEPPGPPTGRTTTVMAAPRPKPRSTSPFLLGLLSLLLGIVACWLPLALPAVETGARGWVLTTLGISAVGCAIAASHAARARYRRTGFLARVGGTLGVIGTVLCLWSVAAFYAPTLVPPLPHLPGPTAAIGTIAEPTPPVTAEQAQRIVAPIEGADVVAPEDQLLANVWHVAFALCIGVSTSASMAEQYPGQFAGVPAALEIAADGTVSSGDATFSKLPADMSLEYSATPDGAYSLTVRDTQSALGFGCDSGSNQIVER